MLSSIYTRSNASFPLRSGYMSGSWFGTHHHPIACVDILSIIGGRYRLRVLGSCSLCAPRMSFPRRGPLLGFSLDSQLANGPMAHPPTVMVFVYHVGMGLIIRDPDSIRDPLRIRSENRISGVPGSG